MDGIEPKYPNIEVTLTGEDGSAFGVLANVERAMRAAGVPKRERDEFMHEATLHDYDWLLQTCMRWVNVA